MDFNSGLAIVSLLGIIGIASLHENERVEAPSAAPHQRFKCRATTAATESGAARAFALDCTPVSIERKT